MQAIRSFSNQDTGTLYLVPTPIGNLDDMTIRAIHTLKAVDLIAAEDTRNTQKLLNHFEIETKQISFHEHNTQERIPQLIQRLKNGENIAQVSDAGMPSISDPGKELVKAAVKENIQVVPLPGANAGITALIASGISPQPFYFYGFLPRKVSEIQAELADLKSLKATMIFYEAPHRLGKTLTQLQVAFGDERQIVLGRELTKRYEEFIRGTIKEVSDWAKENEVRGEFVIMVAGNSQTKQVVKMNHTEIIAEINQLIARGDKPNDAIKKVANQQEMPRQEVYNIYHEIKH